MKGSSREYIAQVTLCERRGWTLAAIRKFLGDPDETRQNPYYPAGPPMRLYAFARVRRVERRKAWREWLIRWEQRKTAAAVASSVREERDRERHERECRERIDAIDAAHAAGRLTPPRLPIELLRTEAAALIAQRVGRSRRATEYDIARHLRNAYTAYDAILESFGYPDQAAYAHLYEVVSREIARVYPELAEMQEP